MSTFNLQISGPLNNMVKGFVFWSFDTKESSVITVNEFGFIVIISEVWAIFANTEFSWSSSDINLIRMKSPGFSSFISPCVGSAIIGIDSDNMFVFWSTTVESRGLLKFETSSPQPLSITDVIILANLIPFWFFVFWWRWCLSSCNSLTIILRIWRNCRWWWWVLLMAFFTVANWLWWVWWWEAFLWWAVHQSAACIFHILWEWAQST